VLQGPSDYEITVATHVATHSQTNYGTCSAKAPRILKKLCLIEQHILEKLRAPVRHLRELFGGGAADHLLEVIDRLALRGAGVVVGGAEKQTNIV